jgi:M6 family metalloprotease-like protein
MRSSGHDLGLGHRNLQMVRNAGKLKVLVILMQFEDHQDRQLIDPPEIHTFFQAEGYDEDVIPTGSVKTYFQINSHESLEIDTLVVPWRVVGFTERDCSFGNSGMSKDFQKCFWPILDLLDELHLDSSHLFNWADFDDNLDGFIDSLVIMHSGYGAEWGGVDSNGRTSDERIWSHSMAAQEDTWRSPSYIIDVGSYCVTSVFRGLEGSAIARLGILVHEMLHTFGLPDLFDLTRSDQLGGVGHYSVMSDVWGEENDGTRPGHLDPWSKIKLGWVTATPISADGTYVLQPSSVAPEVFIIDKPYPEGEYLLIENRQAISYDEGLLTSGALIWHIDDNVVLNTQAGGTYQGAGWPANGNHYQVALVQADGNFDLEQAINKGHADDFFTRGMTLGPGKGGTIYPNTDSYRDGNVVETGVTVSGFEFDGLNLRFEVDGLPEVPNHETVASAASNSCLLQINTGLCTSYMKNSSLVEECDCYSFCGDGLLQGCSKYGEFAWVSCQSGGLVAGCTVDDWIMGASIDFLTPDSDSGLYRPLTPLQEILPDDTLDEERNVMGGAKSDACRLWGARVCWWTALTAVWFGGMYY